MTPSHEPGAPATNSPRYRTWVRLSRVRVFAALSVFCLAGCVLALVSPWFLLFLLPLGAAGYITLILALTMYRLGPHGGDFQRHIHVLIASEVVLPPGGGSALDVGCGSGSLVVRLAQAHPGATATGVDSWGENWEYSEQQCVHNARAEGVAARTLFRRQNGSRLDFPDSSFDAVVSCMTFHEIKENANKTDGILEALRVLRPGGSYVFLDLFADSAFYPPPAEFPQPLSEISNKLRPLGDLMPLPYPLRHPKVLGNAMVVVGAKPAGTGAAD